MPNFVEGLGETTVKNSQLFKDKTDAFEELQDMGRGKLVQEWCNGMGTTFEASSTHVLGSEKECAKCKRHNESKQISTETLKGGFKAASGKATFDLIPVKTFNHLLVDNVVIPEEYRPLVDNLIEFWRDDLISSLYEALDNAFFLLAEETDETEYNNKYIQALFEVGELYALGAKKYSNRNWEKGIDWGIVWSAVFRHLLNRLRGELRDPIDGQFHMTSVVWNIIALIHFTQNPDNYEKFDSRNDIVAVEDRGQK